MRSKIYFPEQASETFEEAFSQSLLGLVPISLGLPYRPHPLRFSVGDGFPVPHSIITYQKEREKEEVSNSD